jgi:hypothetical protein
MNQGVTLTELLTLDAATVSDFVWLMGQREAARKRYKARKALEEDSHVPTRARPGKPPRRR